MANKKRKKPSGFVKGMLLYVLLFLVVATLGLSFLYDFMENYEYTRPNHVMERFIADITPEQVDTMAASFTSTLNTDLCDMEEVRAFMTEKASNASFSKKMAECTETKNVYALKDENGVIGKVELTLGSNTFHGLLANWQPTRGELDFSDYVTDFEISVPSGYTVEYRGAVLDKSYITNEKTEYELLKEFYEDNKLPYLVSYKAEGILGEAAPVVKDAAGNILTEEQLNESFYTDNCTASEKAGLEEFLDRYINAYVTYTSGANGMNSSNYFDLIPMIEPESELRSRVEQAVSGMWFASSRGDELKKITINSAMALGGDRYLCDVTYDVATVGQDSQVREYPNNTKIMIINNGFEYLATAMVSY